MKLTYDNFTTFSFSTSATAERIARKVFTAGNVIALTIFVFELACDAYESGQIMRGWYESARSWWTLKGSPRTQALYNVVARRLSPVVAPLVQQAIAYPTSPARWWSAERLPVTLAANAAWWSEVVADYQRIGQAVHRLIEGHLMGA